MCIYIYKFIYIYILSNVFLYSATIHYPNIRAAVAQPRRGTKLRRLPHDSHEPNKRLRKQIASHNHSNADPPSQPSGCCPQPPSCTLRNVSFPQRRDQIKRNPLAYLEQLHTQESESSHSHRCKNIRPPSIRSSALS